MPIEKTQTAPKAHKKKIAKFTKKKIIGISIILNVDPTKSAAASKIAIEITRVLHKHKMVTTYKNATPQITTAKIRNHVLTSFGLLKY